MVSFVNLSLLNNMVDDQANLNVQTSILTSRYQYMIDENDKLIKRLDKITASCDDLIARMDNFIDKSYQRKRKRDS